MSTIVEKDPICGMEVKPGSESARMDHDGTTYLFCSESCREAFVEDPAKFIRAEQSPYPTPKKKRWKVLGWVIFALFGAGGLATACSRPLTVETVSARLKHGTLVRDRSYVCTLQETLQLRPGIAVTYNGKTYHQ